MAKIKKAEVVEEILEEASEKVLEEVEEADLTIKELEEEAATSKDTAEKVATLGTLGRLGYKVGDSMDLATLNRLARR